MAKKSIVDKNNKRLTKINKMFNFRNKIKVLLKGGEDVNHFLVMKILDKTSSSSYIRYRKRCAMTGRPRGYRGGVGLSRGALRYYASFGMIAGLKKC